MNDRCKTSSIFSTNPTELEGPHDDALNTQHANIPTYDQLATFYCPLVLTISSIFKMLLTVSVANSIALIETNNGWTTFSCSMSEIPPRRTFIPDPLSPLAWRFRKSVTVVIGFKPAFSAKVYGTISNASAYAWKSKTKHFFKIYL